MTENVWLSEEKVCKRLGIGRERLRVLMDQGMPYGKLPDKDQLRFNVQQVDEWLEKNAEAD